MVGFRTAGRIVALPVEEGTTGKSRRAAGASGRRRLSAAGSHRRGDAADAGKRAGTRARPAIVRRTFGPPEQTRGRRQGRPRTEARRPCSDTARCTSAMPSRRRPTIRRTPPTSVRRRSMNGRSRIFPKSAKEHAKSRSPSTAPRCERHSRTWNYPRCAGISRCCTRQ